MSEPFIAEIRIFAGNFAPRSWAFCNGQLLPVSQNTALFSLIGTTYGGDGRTTMALPNMQGRAPMHPGRGPGLTEKRLGQLGGSETVTLSEAQIPNHTHNQLGSNEESEFDGTNNPQSSLPGSVEGGKELYADGNNLQPISESAVENTGGSQPHNNMQPFLSMNFIIALQGLYPSRS
ncbi:phage tail protein [Kangiella koreensis]|uniref:Tail Collar domain protein n=1 Tax=Kangiella koreensis (strain DSM 16069 / JCM 12317 / KCTC 12182 / SW-125) TaxID=523791 RepID=C7R9Z2_KANKD|nr:tail fiber protein [Kangiella koreensis]ACV28011.1 Tail Collar domain protein [Kangiella koreensis DSM 16069]